MVEVEVHPDRAAAALAVAEAIAEAGAGEAQAGNRFHLALAGGSTPRDAYEQLAEPAVAGRVDWDSTQVWFGDERCVPPHDEQSNYRMARIALLDHVPLSPAQVHRIHGEGEPSAEARRYERELREAFGLGEDGVPALSLVLLGLGPEGHTASLFPHDPALRAVAHLCVPVFVQQKQSYRITLTYPVLNAARRVLFFAAGPEKAEIVARLVGTGEPDPALPASMVRPASGPARLVLDAEAAELIPHHRKET